MTSKTLRAVLEDTPEFTRELDALAHRGDADLSSVEAVVRKILDDVRKDGDAALRRSVREFERRDVDRLLLRDYGGKAALESLPTAVQHALIEAAARIRRYHERQAQELTGFEYRESGVLLGSRVQPLASVGVYAPGGKATYPSSVLMCAVIARVAGVGQVIVANPNPGPEVRAACHVAGVDAILDAGGAQAIAALAYGTASVPRVDKIVGPGNLYVTAAKRLVFGRVDIDSLAGPSEILVIADDSADPLVVAADLLSQAEHDEAAYPLLVCTSESFVERVRAELSAQLQTLPRKAIAGASLAEHGVALVVRERARLAEVASILAVEHVAVHTENARALADAVRYAGAIFIGPATPEAAGDYLAGPSHVLPTGGAARFGAPLGVYDFIARTSLIGYEAPALAAQSDDITSFARAEGLEAHARAVEVRVGPAAARRGSSS